MRSVASYDALDRFGRIRLSKHFFMRDFMYSEISNFFGIPNLPDNPDLAVEVGKRLCNDLLEPINATFGRVSVRSAYRSCAVNQFGNDNGHNCASNEANYAGHIWDRRDNEGGIGATACIVVPWFTDRYAAGTDWRALAYWIHDHLPYSELEFFDGKGLCPFNITWHEKPKKVVRSWINRSGLLRDLGAPGTAELYREFPPYVASA